MQTNKNRKLIILIVSFMILAVIAFTIGYKVAGSKNKNLQNRNFGSGNSFPNQMGIGNKGMSRGGVGVISGEILSKDAQSITVKLRDGGSKIIFISDKTTVSKSVDGTKDDLIVGKQITVNGASNPDGSVNAESLQIRTMPITPEVKQ